MKTKPHCKSKPEIQAAFWNRASIVPDAKLQLKKLFYLRQEHGWLEGATIFLVETLN